MTPEVRLEVVVTPRASTDEVRVDGEALRVRVTAPPADGRANAAAVRVLARALSVPARDIRIIAGATARRKVVAISGLDDVMLRERLSAADARAARRRRR